MNDKSAAIAKLGESPLRKLASALQVVTYGALRDNLTQSRVC